jgi:tetrahydromethanopterin S-methyltransferase subunit B
MMHEAMKDIEVEVRELDKRMTHVEAVVDTILKSMGGLEKTLDKLTDGQHQLEIKLAYTAGILAVGIVIAEVIIQAAFTYLK